MLDDGSSSSYMNEDVAGALGITVPYEPVAVQVLNDTVATFDAMPVNVTLQSDDGRNFSFSAYAGPRQITGKYRMVDWRRYQSRCLHL